jgi:hypothetical protein
MIRVDRFRYSQLAIWIALAAASTSVPACFGQAVAGGSISGQVSDSSGASVQGADVTATQTETKFSRAAKTDLQGRYTLTNLPVGPYLLRVKAPGFKSFEQSGIILEVGNNIQANAAMQLGAVSESIEVTAGASMVETKENDVAQVVNQRQINDLPLNGRQATQLILISGAATQAPSDSLYSTKNHPSSVTMSVAGGQANATNYLLDGGNNIQTFTNLNLPFPFPDALQEFSVETSSLPARNGSHPGGLVNVVTKSGTNKLHGDMFDYLRNGDLNARNFFAAAHDSLKRNQFGGTIGDKIITDKLFFFAGYQGTRTHTQPPQTISYVPTSTVLAGDFSTLLSAGCQSTGKAKALTDPTTGAPFPNSQIPVTRFDPAAVKVAGYLPAAQTGCGKVTYGIPQVNDEDQIVGRIDYVRSAKQSIFGRYYLNDYTSPAFWNPQNALWTANPGNYMRSQSMTLGDTYSIGPALVNSFHVTATRMRNNRSPSGQQLDPSILGINSYTATPHDIRIDVSNYFTVGCGNCAPGHFNTNSFQASDDVDLVHGRHQLAFGVDFMRSQNNLYTGNNQNGQFDNNGSYTGDSLADFMLGDLSLFDQNRPQRNALRESMPAAYIQDTFHASDRVTLNAGVRWEPMLMPYDYFGRGASFNMQSFLANQHSTVYPNAPAGMFYYGDAGIPKSYANSKWGHFAPRVGLVFNPHGDGRDTLRIGGGILYDVNEMYYGQRLTSNPPFSNDVSQTSPTAHLANPWVGYPGGNPFPGLYQTPNASTVFPVGGLYIVLNPNMKPTYMAQWNVTYQRQLPGNWMFSASYLASKTTHVWLQQDINPAVYIPGTCSGKACSTTTNSNQRRVLYLAYPSQGQYIAQMITADTGGNSFYQGALTSIQHRFSHNFSTLVNYTWSHCIDDEDFVGDMHNSQYQNPYNRRGERGDCNFDFRQVFNATAVYVSPKGGSLLGRIAGNWELAPLIRGTSGAPLTVNSGKDNSLTAMNPVTDRPNLVLPNAVYNSTIGPALQWFNPAAFAANPTGTYGNSGRDTLRGPGTFNFDVSLSRSFKFGERITLQARGEAFNIINHTNLGFGTSGAGTVGASMNITSSTFGQLTAAADPRIMQFALKLMF